MPHRYTCPYIAVLWHDEKHHVFSYRCRCGFIWWRSV